MKTLIAGCALMIADYGWLLRVVTWLENPLVYNHQARSNLHFWTFLLFTSVAHITMAVGISLYILGRKTTPEQGSAT